MTEYRIELEDPKDYAARLRCGVALLEPIAFALEKNELSAADYSDAVSGAMEYLTLLHDELLGGLCTVHKEE